MAGGMMGNEADDRGLRIFGVLNEFLEDGKAGAVTVAEVSLDLAEDGAWGRG